MSPRSSPSPDRPPCSARSAPSPPCPSPASPQSPSPPSPPPSTEPTPDAPHPSVCVHPSVWCGGGPLHTLRCNETLGWIAGFVVTRPGAIVIAGPGTNRDTDAVLALDLAGAEPTVVLAAELSARPELLDAARIAVVAGGFSYGDAL